MADNKIRYEISTDVKYNIRTNDFSIEHTHDYWEIVFVVSGRIFNCINGEVTAIEKNMAALIKPDDLHSIRVDGNSTMYYNLEIRKELFKEFLDTIDTELYEEVLSGKNLLGRFDEEFSENVKQFVTDMLRYGTVEEEKRGLKRLIFRLIFDLLPMYPYSIAGQGKIDNPPIFSPQGNWFKEFKVFNDHFTRLGYIVANTREKYDIAILHPQREVWLEYVQKEDYESVKGIEDEFNKLLDALRRKGVTYQLIDERILERYGKIENGALQVGENNYETLVIPKMRTISRETYNLLRG